jgi:nucleotide-binding universal stress UspA family protein
MYQHILVPFDGSTRAEGVLPHVQELAKSLGAELVRLRIVFAHVFPGADSVQAEVTAFEKAHRYLSGFAK